MTGTGLNAGPPKLIDTSSGQFSIVLEAGDYTVTLPLILYRRPFGISVPDSTDTIDLATVLGLGFAPFRGGLARFADAVGIEKVVKLLRDLSHQHSPRFEPATLLKKLAELHRPLREFAAASEEI